MAARTRRIGARVNPGVAGRITEAAFLTGESVSAFIVRASLVEADRVLARADMTFMPAVQFDAMLESLDDPDSAPRLTQAAARPRRYQRP
jgi:uncharacterized protein (DUF1778 family)